MSAEHGKDGIQDIQTALKIAGEKLGVRFNARDAQRSINRVLHAGEVRGVFYPYDREKALKSILQKPDDSHKGDVFLLFWNENNVSTAMLCIPLLSCSDLALCPGYELFCFCKCHVVCIVTNKYL